MREPPITAIANVIQEAMMQGPGVSWEEIANDAAEAVLPLVEAYGRECYEQGQRERRGG